MANCGCGNPITGTLDFLCTCCKNELHFNQSVFSSPQKPPRSSNGIPQPTFQPHPNARHVPLFTGVTTTPDRKLTIQPHTYAEGAKLQPRTLHFPALEPTGINAHPQINFLDELGRLVATFAFLFFGQPIFSANGRTYRAFSERNGVEQASASHVGNMLAAPSKPRFHGSHNSRHKSAGDSSRTNMHPTSAYCNTRIIGTFEQQIERLLPNYFGMTIDLKNELNIYLQVTEAQFNKEIVMPYLLKPSAVKQLSTGGKNPQQMIQDIQALANKIPVSHHQTVYCGTLELQHNGTLTRVWRQLTYPQPLNLDINDILSRAGSPENPRFSLSHLMDKITINQYNLYRDTVGKSGQFATSEPRSQEMFNISMFQDIKANVGAPDNVAKLLQTYHNDSKYHEQWTEMDTVRATATGLPQHFTTGRTDDRTVQDAQEFIGRLSNKRKRTSLDAITNTL